MKRQLILGMGAGQCGLPLLAQVLGKQPGARVSHQQPPLLPWMPDISGLGVRQRLQRLLDAGKERFVGDVASFYLPYIEEAIRFDPESASSASSGRGGKSPPPSAACWTSRPIR